MTFDVRDILTAERYREEVEMSLYLQRDNPKYPPTGHDE